MDFGIYFSTIFSTFWMAGRSGHVAKWLLGDQNKPSTVRTEQIEFVYPENVGCPSCQSSEQYARLSNLAVEFIIQDRLLQQSMDNARHVPHAEENAVQPS